jgi:hypothetical protein
MGYLKGESRKTVKRTKCGEELQERRRASTRKETALLVSVNVSACANRLWWAVLELRTKQASAHCLSHSTCVQCARVMCTHVWRHQAFRDAACTVTCYRSAWQTLPGAKVSWQTVTWSVYSPARRQANTSNADMCSRCRSLQYSRHGRGLHPTAPPPPQIFCTCVAGARGFAASVWYHSWRQAVRLAVQYQLRATCHQLLSHDTLLTVPPTKFLSRNKTADKGPWCPLTRMLGGEYTTGQKQLCSFGKPNCSSSDAQRVA